MQKWLCYWFQRAPKNPPEVPVSVTSDELKDLVQGLQVFMAQGGIIMSDHEAEREVYAMLATPRVRSLHISKNCIHARTDVLYAYLSEKRTWHRIGAFEIKLPAQAFGFICSHVMKTQERMIMLPSSPQWRNLSRTALQFQAPQIRSATNPGCIGTLGGPLGNVPVRETISGAFAATIRYAECVGHHEYNIRGWPKVPVGEVPQWYLNYLAPAKEASYL